MLDFVDPAQVQMIDEETLLIFADPQAINEWTGAAILFHIPTLSMLVLDHFGDVDPQASSFGNRAGVAALREVTGKSELMAGIQTQVQEKWQSTPSGLPEIRLGTVWQDGQTTIFLVSIAGLSVDDDRSYCPSETW